MVGNMRVVFLLLCRVVAKELLCEAICVYTEGTWRDELVTCSECHSEVIPHTHRLVSKCYAQQAYRCAAASATA